MIESNKNSFSLLADNIFFLLRSHQKIPENLLEELYNEMRQIVHTYRSSYTLPKWIAALLFDLSTNKFADDIETLNLSDAVENIKISNDKFKIIYSELAAGKDSLKPNYDSRSLRIELTETVVLYMNYVQTLAEASAGKEMTALNNSIKDVSKTYFQQIAERHSGVPSAE